MLLRILLAAVLILGLYTGYRFWTVGQAYAVLRAAPQGQSIGPDDASIVMVELMDYRCPACRLVNKAVEEAADANPDVRVIFRQLPIFGEQSMKEAQIALAAGLQGHFREMHDILIARTAPVQDSEIDALATQAGVDPARLKQDMADPALKEEVMKTKYATQAMGIRSTPTFLIGKTLYSFKDQLPAAADFAKIFADIRAGQ